MAQETSVSIWSGKKVELEMQPVVVAGIEFDALIQADMQMTSTLPQYTVEKGYVITDNIVLKPETMNLTLFLTDTPVTWYERKGHGAGHTLETIDKLRDLYYKRQLFSVITREAEYEDMFVTSISIQKSKEIGYSRQVTMALQQVRVTEAKTVEIPETYGKALPELTGSSDVNDTVETLGVSEEPTGFSSNQSYESNKTSVSTSQTSHTYNGENISKDNTVVAVRFKKRTSNETKYCFCLYNNDNFSKLSEIRAAGDRQEGEWRAVGQADTEGSYRYYAKNWKVLYNKRYPIFTPEFSIKRVLIGNRSKYKEYTDFSWANITDVASKGDAAFTGHNVATSADIIDDFELSPIYEIKGVLKTVYGEKKSAYGCYFIGTKSGSDYYAPKFGVFTSEADAAYNFATSTSRVKCLTYTSFITKINGDQKITIGGVEYTPSFQSVTQLLWKDLKRLYKTMCTSKYKYGTHFQSAVRSAWDLVGSSTKWE